MYALIKNDYGGYYGSTVFGYYTSVTATDDYKRYLERMFSQYYVVLNEEKDRLIDCYVYQSENKHITKHILIVDGDQEDWLLKDDYTGGVSFLPRELADRFIADEVTPTDILERCLEIDNAYEFNEYPEIKNQKDIDDLNWAAGNFHDAYIVDHKLIADDVLYVKFDGTWGCNIEMWFSGDLEYDMSSVDPDTGVPYWIGSTMLIQDGFIYFVDDLGMTVEKISKKYCWFKARNVRYHVIPVQKNRRQ